jgi:hypothetical protein
MAGLLAISPVIPPFLLIYGAENCFGSFQCGLSDGLLLIHDCQFCNAPFAKDGFSFHDDKSSR